MDNVTKVQNLLKSAAKARTGDDKAFMLLQLALCGHMTLEQQGAFLADAKNRGLISGGGVLLESIHYLPQEYKTLIRDCSADGGVLRKLMGTDEVSMANVLVKKNILFKGVSDDKQKSVVYFTNEEYKCGIGY